MNFSYFLLTERFNQMERYLSLIQNALSDEQENFKAYLQDLEERNKEDIIDGLYDQLIEVRDEFPRITFSNFMVSWYAVIEHELLQLCIGEDLSITVKIYETERVGSGIQRAYKFLRDGAGYEIPNILWQELNKIRIVRNKIVHNDGRVNTYPEFLPVDKKTITKEIERFGTKLVTKIETDENLYNYLEQHNMIDFHEALLYIKPSFEYCSHLINLGRELFSLTYKALGLIE